MAAVKHSYGGLGANAAQQQYPKPQWERTPWWMFWRSYWRRPNPGWMNSSMMRPRYEYRSKRQLAHEFLEKQFNVEVPTQQHRGGVDSRAWTGRPR